MTNKNLKLALALATAIPMVSLLDGCDQKTSPYAPQATTTTPSPFKLETIAKGQFLGLEDGMYKLTIKAKQAGTPNDLSCIIVTQDDGVYETTMACDYVAAHAPAKAPAPKAP